MSKVSFRLLWENMHADEKDAEHIDTKSMQAIRAGISINETFWDDFLQVCNNTDALADLLNIRPEQIASWGSRVKHNLELVNKADKKQNAEKTKVMDTGDDFGNENIV